MRWVSHSVSADAELFPFLIWVHSLASMMFLTHGTDGSAQTAAVALLIVKLQTETKIVDAVFSSQKTDRSVFEINFKKQVYSQHGLLCTTVICVVVAHHVVRTQPAGEKLKTAFGWSRTAWETEKRNRHIIEKIQHKTIKYIQKNCNKKIKPRFASEEKNKWDTANLLSDARTARDETSTTQATRTMGFFIIMNIIFIMLEAVGCLSRPL